MADKEKRTLLGRIQIGILLAVGLAVGGAVGYAAGHYEGRSSQPSVDRYEIKVDRLNNRNNWSLFDKQTGAVYVTRDKFGQPGRLEWKYKILPLERRMISPLIRASR